MQPIWWTLLVTVLSGVTASASETETKNTSPVEVRTGKTVTTGKLLARSKDRATLLDRAGRLHEIDLKASTFTPLNGSFQSLPTTELRNQLSREFGKDFEVGATRHYLVLAPRGKASSYAAVFEDQYATLQRYFKTRSFSLADPEFLLTAIIFPERQPFVDYVQADGAKTMAGMLGYYSPRTNRVALYESREKSVALSAVDPASGVRQPPEVFDSTETCQFDSFHSRSSGASRPPLAEWQPRPLFGSVQGDLKATMIHEATHQIAYNIGLHSRLGETPRWVVEGMATVFEPEGVHDSSAGWSAKQRINRDRFISFQNFAKNRRAPKSLKSFIEGDSLYQSAVLDFYAQSWALSFFLVETRPRNYSTYLKRIAARDPFADYPANERLADFKEAFQVDVDWLDVQFLRYLDGLK